MEECSIFDDFERFLKLYKENNDEYKIRIILEKSEKSGTFCSLKIPNNNINFYKKYLYYIFNDAFDSLIKKLNKENNICIINDIKIQILNDNNYIICRYTNYEYSQITTEWNYK